MSIGEKDQTPLYLFNMKIILCFIGLLSLSSVSLAQSFASLSVIVLDKETKKPIPGVSILIKENGWNGGPTASDGRFLFSKSVPIGEITYLASREGYQGIQDRMNITTEAKSNTLAIELVKTPLPTEDKILIKGEVSDKNNKDVEGALVEVKVADITQTAKTDQSGNYTVVLTLSKSAFEENTIRVEVKYKDCKKTEAIELTRSKVINKNIVLDCGATQVRNGNGGGGGPVSTPLKKETVSDLEIAIEKCELSGNKLICYVTYQYVGASPNTTVIFRTTSGKVIDEGGNTYISEAYSLGNVSAKSKYTPGRVELVRNVVVKGKIEFSIGDPFTRIASLTIGEKQLVHKIYDIPVAN